MKSKSELMRPWSTFLSLAAAVLGLGLTAGPSDARTLCVGKETVLLRAGPSLRHNPVGSLPAGACGIQVVGQCADGWCDVALGNRRGWVNSRRVTVHEGSPPASK